MKWNFLYQITAASRTPDYGATAPKAPFSLSSVLNWICWTLPRTKFLGTPLFGSRRIQKSVVKTVDRKVPAAPQRIVVTSAMYGNMCRLLEPNEQISRRTKGKRGWGGREERETMLLVWLLRDTFSGLWNVIGGFGIAPGEWPLRHTVLRTSRLGVPTAFILCGPRADRQSCSKAVTPVWVRWVIIANSFKFCSTSLEYHDSVQNFL
jgi:hypothetical protein